MIDIMRDKLKCTPEQLQQAEAYIDGCAQRVAPVETIHLVKSDPSDNRIIECALAAGSDTIVSGDKHLLSLVNIHGIEFLNVSDFLQRGRVRSDIR
jgi:predicted nucleic acid-binding protein